MPTECQAGSVGGCRDMNKQILRGRGEKEPGVL